MLLSHTEQVQAMFNNIQVIYPDNAEARIVCNLCDCETDHGTIHDEGIMLHDRDDVEANALHHGYCPITKWREDEHRSELVESYSVFNLAMV